MATRDYFLTIGKIRDISTGKLKDKLTIEAPFWDNLDPVERWKRLSDCMLQDGKDDPEAVNIFSIFWNCPKNTAAERLQTLR